VSFEILLARETQCNIFCFYFNLHRMLLPSLSICICSLSVAGFSVGCFVLSVAGFSFCRLLLSRSLGCLSLVLSVASLALQTSVISFPDSFSSLCRRCSWCCNYRIALMSLLVLPCAFASTVLFSTVGCFVLEPDAVRSCLPHRSIIGSPNMVENYSNRLADCNNSER
jgi:hypothetical protein